MEQNNQEMKELKAAVLAMSEGVDALREIMEKNLSFQVDLYENKIHKDFMPKRIKRTRARYEEWLEGGVSKEKGEMEE